MASLCLLSIDGVNLDPVPHTFLNIKSLTALSSYNITITLVAVCKDEPGSNYFYFQNIFMYALMPFSSFLI
jgi:hypothetical protein